MFRLAAMARSAEADVAIGGYLLDSVTTMTGDAIGAGADTPQIGMSAIRNILMGFEMAGAATYWLGRFGVRPFWEATMALGAGKLFVRGLNQVGRIVMAGQALLRSGRQLRDSSKGIRSYGQKKPNKEKAPGRLSAEYAPHHQA